MIVVGLNQTIDRTIRLPALGAGHVLRATDVEVTAGGKAVNVCRAALTLQAPAQLVGTFPGRLGGVAVALLDAEGLHVTAVPAAGELRGTTVIIEDDGRTTVINEPGPALSTPSGSMWSRAVATAIEVGSHVAISGSVPPGTVADAHRQLIELVHSRGGTVAVDVTAGAVDRSGRRRRRRRQPEPRRSRASARRRRPGNAAQRWRGRRPRRDRRHRDRRAMPCGSGRARRRRSRRRAGVGRSPRRRLSVARRRPVRAAPRVPVTNPIGAGDALLGATLAALERGRPLEAAVTDGVAYAAASVAHPVAGYADPELVAELAAQLSETRPMSDTRRSATGRRCGRSRRGLPQDRVPGAQQRGQRSAGQGRSGPARRGRARLPTERVRQTAAHPWPGIDGRVSSRPTSATRSGRVCCAASRR